VEGGAVERLWENLADFNEKLFKNLYQDRFDGLITGHVLVQISRFLESFSAKPAKFSRNRSTFGRPLGVLDFNVATFKGGLT
jgi:hypothetical protein